MLWCRAASLSSSAVRARSMLSSPRTRTKLRKSFSKNNQYPYCIILNARGLASSATPDVEEEEQEDELEELDAPYSWVKEFTRVPLKSPHDLPRDLLKNLKELLQDRYFIYVHSGQDLTSYSATSDLLGLYWKIMWPSQNW